MKKITVKFPSNRQSGQVVLVTILMFLFISLSIVLGFGSVAVKNFKNTESFMQSKQSLLASESGMEDVVYRLKNAMTTNSSETLTLNGSTVTTTISDVGSDKQVISSGDTSSRVRKVQSLLTVSSTPSGASFNFGVQVGAGGFTLHNSSSIKGNVYSNGPIEGSGNYIYGDVISAGASGKIEDIHATGTARAHLIEDSIIDKDAYYVTKTDTTVGGTSHPGSANQPTLSMPISYSQISDWEANALIGGTEECAGSPYKITSNTTLGPKKINCDLYIKGPGVTLTLTGTLWVKGNITLKGAELKVSPSIPGKSVVVVADNPLNQTTSSKIIIETTSTFTGTGTGSYVLMISQNKSAELGGSEIAVDMGNTASGAVMVYAGHGLIEIGQSGNLKELTGYKITAQNSAQVIYESGVASPLFSGGPSGSLNIKTWREIQ